MLSLLKNVSHPHVETSTGGKEAGFKGQIGLNPYQPWKIGFPFDFWVLEAHTCNVDDQNIPKLDYDYDIFYHVSTG